MASSVNEYSRIAMHTAESTPKPAITTPKVKSGQKVQSEIHAPKFGNHTPKVLGTNVVMGVPIHTQIHRTEA